MPLVTATLEADIKAVYDTVKSYGTESAPKSGDDAIAYIASGIAAAVDKYIKTATVTSVPVLVAPPGGGPVTGEITNTIS